MASIGGAIMPRTLDELAEMIARRDNISLMEAMAAIRDTAGDLEYAFYNGNVDLAETILAEDLGVEPDYLDLFIL